MMFVWWKWSSNKWYSAFSRTMVSTNQRRKNEILIEFICLIRPELNLIQIHDYGNVILENVKHFFTEIKWWYINLYIDRKSPIDQILAELEILFRKFSWENSEFINETKCFSRTFFIDDFSIVNKKKEEVKYSCKTKVNRKKSAKFDWSFSRKIFLFFFFIKVSERFQFIKYISAGVDICRWYFLDVLNFGICSALIQNKFKWLDEENLEDMRMISQDIQG